MHSPFPLADAGLCAALPTRYASGIHTPAGGPLLCLTRSFPLFRDATTRLWVGVLGPANTTMAFLGLLEGQQNQPKPHADLFSEVMVSNTFDPLASLMKTPDEDSRCHHRCAST